MKELFNFSVNNSVRATLTERRSQLKNRGDGVVTYSCQRDGPEGYYSPVPASERLEHQAQARAWQANKCTTALALSHTQHTHTQRYHHTQTHTTSFVDTDNFLTKPKTCM